MPYGLATYFQLSPPMVSLSHCTVQVPVTGQLYAGWTYDYLYRVRAVRAWNSINFLNFPSRAVLSVTTCRKYKLIKLPVNCRSNSGISSHSIASLRMANGLTQPGKIGQIWPGQIRTPGTKADKSLPSSVHRAPQASRP